MKPNTLTLVVLALLTYFAIPESMQALVPAPEGYYPNYTTAEGCNALNFLTTGSGNTGLGWRSLFFTTTGSFNTGVGGGALALNNGDSNTAVGAAALLLNTDGFQNTANGALALLNNIGGAYNTANGDGALYNNTTGNSNTAIGFHALYSNITGSVNTAIGSLAGIAITGTGNVCIGQNIVGAAGVNDTTWLRNVYASVATGRAVYVNDDNKVGTLSSSRRYKDEIKPIAQASEAILSLKPVSFRYKKEVDPGHTLSFGLIAEEVTQVDPHLVTVDRDGKPETVRYEAVNAMLLNEFLKAHRKIEEQGAMIAQQQKQIEALTARLQKVTARFELDNPAPQTVKNND